MSREKLETIRAALEGFGRDTRPSTAATWVWTIRDGQAVRMEMFANKAEALEAVGLSGPSV
jgi:ketosteroid isomerase-like protein